MSRPKEWDFVTACAKAMGIHPNEQIVRSVNYDYALSHMGYDPLSNDTQAMALVKKFGLKLYPNDSAKGWTVISRDGLDTFSKDLNHAIVECVASSTRGVST